MHNLFIFYFSYYYFNQKPHIYCCVELTKPTIVHIIIIIILLLRCVHNPVPGLNTNKLLTSYVLHGPNINISLTHNCMTQDTFYDMQSDQRWQNIPDNSIIYHHVK